MNYMIDNNSYMSLHLYLSNDFMTTKIIGKLLLPSIVDTINRSFSTQWQVILEDLYCCISAVPPDRCSSMWTRTCFTTWSPTRTRELTPPKSRSSCTRYAWYKIGDNNTVGEVRQIWDRSNNWASKNSQCTMLK